MGDDPATADRTVHARIEKGTVMIMASDTQPGASFTKGNNFFICMDCESAEELERLHTALAEGGTTTMEPQDTFWGARFSTLADRHRLDVQLSVAVGVASNSGEERMQSKSKTVREYLESLPDDRRKAVEAVRKVVRANIDDDIKEGMAYGMIAWYVPHEVFPDGYHVDPKQPLPYAALASQKNYMSLYLNTVYGAGGEAEKWFRSTWEKSGKKLDMGKSCIRFRKTEDLALDVVAEAIRRIPTKKHIENYLKNRPSPTKKKKA